VRVAPSASQIQMFSEPERSDRNAISCRRASSGAGVEGGPEVIRVAAPREWQRVQVAQELEREPLSVGRHIERDPGPSEVVKSTARVGFKAGCPAAGPRGQARTTAARSVAVKSLRITGLRVESDGMPRTEA